MKFFEWLPSPDLDAQLLPAEPAKEILRQLGEQGELARLLAPVGWAEEVRGLGEALWGAAAPPTSTFLSFFCFSGRAEGNAGAQGGLGCPGPPSPGTLLARSRENRTLSLTLAPE